MFGYFISLCICLTCGCPSRKRPLQKQVQQQRRPREKDRLRERLLYQKGGQKENAETLLNSCTKRWEVKQENCKIQDDSHILYMVISNREFPVVLPCFKETKLQYCSSFDEVVSGVVNVADVSK